MYAPIFEQINAPKWKEAGQQKGLREGKLETARNLLGVGMTIDQVVIATEPPETDVRNC